MKPKRGHKPKYMSPQMWGRKGMAGWRRGPGENPSLKNWQQHTVRRDQLSVKLQLGSKTDSLQFSSHNELTSSSFTHYLFTFSSTGVFFLTCFSGNTWVPACIRQQSTSYLVPPTPTAILAKQDSHFFLPSWSQAKTIREIQSNCYSICLIVKSI